MDTLGKTIGKVNFVPKGWGYELIIANNPFYCGKLLHFVAGKKCSVHIHRIKQESFFLRKGRMEIFYFDDEPSLQAILKKEKSQEDAASKIYELMEKVTLTQGMSFEVPVGRVHQMLALEDSELFEFSTQDFPSDSYRILKGD
jgi:hypothetical protein